MADNMEGKSEMEEVVSAEVKGELKEEEEMVETSSTEEVPEREEGKSSETDRVDTSSIEDDEEKKSSEEDMVVNGVGGHIVEHDLEYIEARLKEMAAETEKLMEIQAAVEKELDLQSLSSSSVVEMDHRSVYVGNVDYGATASEIEKHFNYCGPINRVTILCNKYDGHPKGFAYIEFMEKKSAEKALNLHGSLFRGRQIRVLPKRTNRPGMTRNYRGGFGGRGTGRGLMGRGRGGGYYARRGRPYRQQFPYFPKRY